MTTNLICYFELLDNSRKGNFGIAKPSDATKTLNAIVRNAYGIPLAYVLVDRDTNKVVKSDWVR